MISKTTIEKLAEFGQSAWLDNINRSMLETGELKKLIDMGLRGMTSNPAIFDKSIRLTDEYNEKIEKLYRQGKTVFEIYDDLTVEDVRDAADIFRSVYDATGGLDGYVSLEVSPKLAFDAEATIKDARRLVKKVDRRNVMFKIPATDAGYKAIEELIAGGININATLIFSLEQYSKTAEAYIRGLKKLLQNGGDIKKVRSVASVFVSRIDTVVDKMISDDKPLQSLKGKAAVANSGLIFGKYLEIFSGEEFKILKEKGANLQRVLWASTSTKNPDYSDIKYVAELIGRNTVNTLPDNTLKAFLDHGEVRDSMGILDVSESERVLSSLKAVEIDINKVCSGLLDKGIEAFENSFDTLLSSINAKAKQLHQS